MDGYPLKIYDEHGMSEFVDPGVDNQIIYAIEGDHKHKFGVNPYMLEIMHTKKRRPEPKVQVIQQGKWECYPAAVANMIGEKLFHVKRAFGKENWRNDESGAKDDVAVAALKHLGLFAVSTTEIPEDYEKCIVMMKSLNVKGMGHAVAYNGSQMIDPNWGREDRKWWGTEWKPRTIGAKRFLVLVENQEIADHINKLEREIERMRVAKIRSEKVAALAGPLEF
jgi:hypothetical protein